MLVMQHILFLSEHMRMCIYTLRGVYKFVYQYIYIFLKLPLEILKLENLIKCKYKAELLWQRTLRYKEKNYILSAFLKINLNV